MSKSRRIGRKTTKKGSKFIKSVRRNTRKAIPVVASGLQTIGKTAKSAAVASIPIAQKGVSVVYGTLAQGFDLGLKGVSKLRNKSRSRRYGRS